MTVTQRFIVQLIGRPAVLYVSERPHCLLCATAILCSRWLHRELRSLGYVVVESFICKCLVLNGCV
jgi:hypothetical protein